MKNEPERFAFWHGLFLGESCALFIALATTTIVPSKTGSITGISGHFFKEPTFIQEFWVNLVFINVILVLLAAGIAVWWWKTGSNRSSTPEE
jgi:hypothetical protein